MQQSNGTVIFTTFVILALIGIGWFVYSPHPAQEQLPSTFSLSPQPSFAPSPTIAEEPVVTTWTTYTNNDYNFTIPIPDGWKQQEYKLPSGVFIVAFSPDDLPCANCSYVHEGYFSIRVFNQKTDSEAYKTFTDSLQKIGKVAGYQAAQINNVKGVLYANTVEVETHGLVYQLVLDKDNGTKNITDSQLFIHAASSMQFTYLIFSQ